MASHKMPKDVEARIRALPGNNMCVDCRSLTPQWASVSYGTLMCLECSGQHRSLGVHISFVRSVQMDSWTERQIEAMQTSGGNASFTEYMQSRNIPKEWPIGKKYASKQAAYYRERLERRLNGKTEPPPDPGCWDPVSGGDALGAEPLPGETAEQYNARQARLRDATRERMAQKFGNGGIGGGGMSGLGCDPGEERSLGSMLSGVGSFLKSKTLDNDELISALGGGVTGVADAVGNLWGGASARLGGRGEQTPSQHGRMQAAPDSEAVCWHPPSLGGTGGRRESCPRDDDWESFINKAPVTAKAVPVKASATPSTTASEASDDEPAASVNSSNASTPVKTSVRAAQVAPSQQPVQRKASNLAGGGASPIKKKEPVKLASSDDFFAEFGV